jgi:hypothetical protein
MCGGKGGNAAGFNEQYLLLAQPRGLEYYQRYAGGFASAWRRNKHHLMVFF